MYWQLSTLEVKKKFLWKNVSVLSIYKGLFSCVSLIETSKPGTGDEPKEQFLPFIPEFCMMAGFADNEMEEIQTSTVLNNVQSTNLDRGVAFAYVGKPSMRVYIEGDEVLMSVWH